MRVLHLSDLHVTPPFKSLEDMWHGPAAVLKPASFDFVIVSGDLSVRGTAPELEKLGAFAEKELIPLLKRAEPARVIMVPGNHDVDWAVDIGRPISIARELERPEKLEKEIREFLKRPDEAELRFVVSKYGHLELHRLDPELYPRRLANVQDMFNTFYKGSLEKAPNRAFDLRDRDEGEHWSAHVFPDEKVAFFGFSSVGRNDRFWQGASLAPKALFRARQWADRHAKGMQRVAVWHHGFLGDRGRPDHLNVLDLGLLHNAGFRIGFHGHTHRASVDTLDALFRERMILISTGSLGAGPAERPDSAANQFSIARIHPGQVDVEVWEREGTTGTYRANAERRRLYLLRTDERRLDHASRCAELTRTWRVTPDGVARVKVSMTQLRLQGEVAVAIVPPPFWYVAHKPNASTPRGQLDVTRTEAPDGRVRLTLTGEHGTYKRCEWEYTVANSVALDQADLELREPRSQWQQPDLDAGEDGRSYTVHFPCERLTLSVVFDADGVDEKFVGVARAVVDRRIDEGGHERWVREPDEERRARIGVEPRGATLSVEAPLVGCRYTLAYELARKGRAAPRDVLVLASTVLDKCRDAPSPPTEKSLSALLTRGVGDALEKLLGGALGREGVWQGFLWHDKRKQLLPAFGKFPNRSWAARFPAGWGVAGDAFRFARTAAWDGGDAARRAIVHPRYMDVYATAANEYQWIVCAPIVVADAGPAVGVVSVASSRTDGVAEETLRDFAEDAGRGAKADELRASLAKTVSLAFWTTLADGGGLSDRRAMTAKNVAKNLG